MVSMLPLAILCLPAASQGQPGRTEGVPATLAFGSTPHGQLPITTPVMSGCQTLSFPECCLHHDGRGRQVYGGEPCLPALPGNSFSSGNVCEPACWVSGTCGSGKTNQSADSFVCPRIRANNNSALLPHGLSCDSQGMTDISEEECSTKAEQLMPIDAHLLGVGVEFRWILTFTTAHGCMLGSINVDSNGPATLPVFFNRLNTTRYTSLMVQYICNFSARS